MTRRDDDDPWQNHAACLPHADLFASCLERHSLPRQQEAALVCQGCPVRPECNATRVTIAEPYGMWAGIMFKGTHDGVNPLAYARSIDARRQDDLAKRAKHQKRERDETAPTPGIERLPKPKTAPPTARGGRPPIVEDPREQLPIEDLRRARALKRAGSLDPEVLARVRAYGRMNARRERARRKSETDPRPPGDA